MPQKSNPGYMRIVYHRDSSVETRVLAYDHFPYAYQTMYTPPDVVRAVRQGFGLNIDDFDHRQTEWK